MIHMRFGLIILIAVVAFRAFNSVFNKPLCQIGRHDTYVKLDPYICNSNDFVAHCIVKSPRFNSWRQLIRYGTPHIKGAKCFIATVKLQHREDKTLHCISGATHGQEERRVYQTNSKSL